MVNKPLSVGVGTSHLTLMSLTTLNVPLHVQYIQNLGKRDDELMYHLTSHLRLNAVYWGLMALYVMGHKDALDRNEMIDFVMSCWDDEAGSFFCLSFGFIASFTDSRVGGL